MEAIVDRLSKEKLVADVMRDYRLNMHLAQSASDELSVLPQYPLLDWQIKRQREASECLHRHIDAANRSLKKLPLLVEFYLGTY